MPRLEQVKGLEPVVEQPPSHALANAPEAACDQHSTILAQKGSLLLDNRLHSHASHRPG
jgi:hypothetical protein